LHKQNYHHIFVLSIMRKINIALAEDNSFLVKSFLHKLSFFENITVKFTCENGKELLERLKIDHNIDVIFMDINMPEMNGIEATEKVKKIFPHIKIIMLTIYDDTENIYNAIQAGADGYILKEIDPKSLYENIEELISGGVPMTSQIAQKALKLLKKTNIPEISENNLEVIELSSRQIEVLKQLEKGLNYNKIADNLIISPKTVRKHIENIYNKLQVHSKLEAVQKAKKMNLL